MATLRELKGRIGSVASSEKITGAMKMISSAKMHKAEMALKQLQPFRGEIENIIGHLLSADAQFNSPLIATREVRTLAVCVWGSDDGLCGAYNINIFKHLLEAVKGYRATYGDQLEIVIVPIGSKITRAALKIAEPRLRVEPIPGIDSKTTDMVMLFTDRLISMFTAGHVDKVDFLYMHFKSVSRQTPTLEQMLPVEASTFSDCAAGSCNRPYIFEPDANTIFNSVLPMYILAMAHDVFTENRASEQAARIMAMQSANDNAKKLLEQLHLEYNKLRQQSITTELLDILGGQVK